MGAHSTQAFALRRPLRHSSTGSAHLVTPVPLVFTQQKRSSSCGHLTERLFTIGAPYLGTGRVCRVKAPRKRYHAWSLGSRHALPICGAVPSTDILAGYISRVSIIYVAAL